jgi:hypothetical protein
MSIRPEIAEALDLLAGAQTDLRRGWLAGAYDALAMNGQDRACLNPLLFGSGGGSRATDDPARSMLGRALSLVAERL